MHNSRYKLKNPGGRLLTQLSFQFRRAAVVDGHNLGDDGLDLARLAGKAAEAYTISLCVVALPAVRARGPLGGTLCCLCVRDGACREAGELRLATCGVASIRRQRPDGEGGLVARVAGLV